MPRMITIGRLREWATTIAARMRIDSFPWSFERLPKGKLLEQCHFTDYLSRSYYVMRNRNMAKKYLRYFDYPVIHSCCSGSRTARYRPYCATIVVLQRVNESEPATVYCYPKFMVFRHTAASRFE